MKLWLDDIRPPPPGWTWASTVEIAKEWLLTGQVEQASFDHDLGLEEACSLDDREDPDVCPHDPPHQPAPSGTDLVNWMEEHDCWPQQKPTVHSWNPVGRPYMQRVIDKKFGP